MPAILSHDGLRIAALRRDGSRPGRFVLVHATGFCKETWEPMIDRALCGRKILAIDQRGHGDSEVAEPPYDWWDLGRDVLSALDGVGWDGVVGVGHSSGAAALVMAEVLRPGTFSALVLIEPITFGPPFRRMEESPMAMAALRRRPTFDTLGEARASYAARGPFSRWGDEALDAYVEHGFRCVDGRWELKCAPEVEAEYYRSASAHGAWDRLDEVGCPVTLVAGVDSTSHPEAFLGELAARFPAAEICRIPGATHFVPMEQPGVVGRIVAGVVETVD